MSNVFVLLSSALFLCFGFKSNYREIKPRTLKANQAIETKLLNLPDSQFQIETFSWYTFKTGKKTYYLADVLDPSVYNQRVLEIRLIVNATAEDDVPKNYITKNDLSLLDVVYNENGKATRSYYSISQEKAEEIISLSVDAKENSEVYKRLVTSYNSYYSWLTKANLNSKSCGKKESISRIRANSTSPQINQQAPLDYYQKTKEIRKNSALFDKFSYSGQGNESNLNLDSPIVSLIPKSYFTSVGVYYNCGTEWGYYINTIKDNGDNFFSQLLLFDIIQLKAEAECSDQVSIKVIEHKNYKYDERYDAVYFDSVNNLCIGNPSLESNIRYIRCSDDQNAASHPNPGDINYNYTLDDGFAFGDIQVKHIGQEKAASGGADVSKALINSSIDLSLSLLSSGAEIVTPISSFVISKSLSFAFDSLFDKCYPLEYDTSKNITKANGKIIYQYNYNLNDFSNFEKRRNANKLLKSSIIKRPPHSKNQGSNTYNQIESNHQSPLLFKNETDSINFRHAVCSSQTSKNYTARIEHRLTLEVFNDNSIKIFRTSPDFLTTIQSGWGYLYGENIKPTKKILSINQQTLDVAYGEQYSQELEFSPEVSSTYDLVLTEATPDSQILVKEYPSAKNTTSEDIYNTEFISKENSQINYRINCSYKVNVFREKGKTYHIELKRISCAQYFGCGQFTIYEAHPGLGSLEEKPLSHSTSGAITRKIQYNGMQQTYHFYSKKDDISTLMLTSTEDTYITLLDEKYRPFIWDDDSFGSRNAGLIIRRKAYSPIFLSPRLYSKSSTGVFALTISNATWVPKFENRHEVTSTRVRSIKVDCSVEKDYYYLLSFKEDCTFTLYNKYWSEYADLYVYDSAFTPIKDTRMYDDTMLDIKAKVNEVFIIQVNVYNPTNSSYRVDILV